MRFVGLRLTVKDQGDNNRRKKNAARSKAATGREQRACTFDRRRVISRCCFLSFFVSPARAKPATQEKGGNEKQKKLVDGRQVAQNSHDPGSHTIDFSGYRCYRWGFYTQSSKACLLLEVKIFNISQPKSKSRADLDMKQECRGGGRIEKGRGAG
jgi:hypothetical protein